MAHRTEIPYGAYWSTPFAKWQGSFANLHSIRFAAEVTRREMAKRKIAPETIDYGVLGLSVPQKHAFYGFPWLSGLAGMGHIGGPTLMQACATGVRCLLACTQEIEAGMAGAALAVCADRTSNGPHIYYPNPRGQGGTGEAEDWVMENFGRDPLGNHSMLATAENCAAKHKASTEDQHRVVMMRQAQYGMALEDGQAFQKRYMTLPFETPSGNPKRPGPVLEGDEGIAVSTPEGLAKLKPVQEGGTVTFGGQTFPCDGNAGVILATPERARDLSQDPNVRIRILGFGLARADLAFMPEAAIPAAKRALAQAGLEINAVDCVKTHNPFAVNDLIFAQATGFPLERMNNYGCSLIWGHPQAPMGLRSVIELAEELVVRGGGVGLFSGCAAGDTAMAVVIKVGD
ncbi:MAG: thiolase family protein [Rhodospirillales bacterium]|jgi:acetyl-CoA acetyltransferase|nr:thiolase family protein [Rhodospirillales bacterium]MDK9722873.1 thiolase family protein [Rhodospirillales bacterium]